MPKVDVEPTLEDKISNITRSKRTIQVEPTGFLTGIENEHKRLKLDIPTTSNKVDSYSSDSDTDAEAPDEKPFSSLSPDSLFDEPLELPRSSLGPDQDLQSPKPCKPALRTAPPIPGLFFDPSVRLSDALADEVAKFCMEQYFVEDRSGKRINQAMLFERAKGASGSSEERHAAATGSSVPANAASEPIFPTSATSLPPPLLSLLDSLSHILKPTLPAETHKLLFPSPHPLHARQAILNLYAPGEGISPHVDLLRRFGDGIVGVSFYGGCVMQFERVQGENDDAHPEASDAPTEEIYSVYLPQNSIIVLTGDARYRWTHGIARRDGDWVLSDAEGKGEDDDAVCGTEVSPRAGWIPRSTRLSITFRWLLPGADIVGGG
ncbi:hypothetical protein D9757_013263 [Collybiopsis confluens]|uniref:Fe2OG dioxygenase domain-containing protein n=1 Tax=Collybiopsis confluens TaxID=2823264 RepID=A0A8H5LTW2_9AGAR|nr:hypothetical protein D9757_013263 [Collybiopsis confluens]